MPYRIFLGSSVSGAQAASFVADAVVLRAQSTSFTADAFIAAEAGTVERSFTADAVTLKTQLASFSVDAVLIQTFTADAVLRKIGQAASFTGNALVGMSFTADAYIPISRVRHARTGPHSGVDRDIDHTVAWAFDRYLRGDNFQEVLFDIDARLSAREAGFVAHLARLRTEAILKSNQAKSLLTNAYIIIRVLGSFLADAVLRSRLRAGAWITESSIYIEDDVLVAPMWTISTTPRAAFISTASLTHDPTNDPTWWYGDSTPYVTGWAKFTLTSTKTVILDTVMTGGDSAIELWTGGPPSWPSDPEEFGDDNVTNQESPYGFAERIEVLLPAGTYWILVHKFDESQGDFNIVLRMQTTT